MFLLFDSNQNTWGVRTLQDIIIQYAQAYGPNALFTNANPSYSFPEYHAMKNSAVAKEIFGETFVQHFTQTRDWEVRQFAKVVTDWETKRYFEII
jgi:glutamine synthetase